VFPAKARASDEACCAGGNRRPGQAPKAASNPLPIAGGLQIRATRIAKGPLPLQAEYRRGPGFRSSASAPADQGPEPLGLRLKKLATSPALFGFDKQAAAIASFQTRADEVHAATGCSEPRVAFPS